MNKELLLKHLDVLYTAYKNNYSVDWSLIPQHTNVNRYRDAAAEIKLLIVQIKNGSISND